jgi:hypothetical protein
VADRIAFLRGGRFDFIGTPEEARASEIPDLHAFLVAGKSPDAIAPKGGPP